MFQPVYKYTKTVAEGNRVTASKSKGLLNRSIKPLVAFNNGLTTALTQINSNYKYNITEVV